MASQHTVADDIVYDLIAIQYHALKGAQNYEKYLGDLHDEHDEVADFIRRCQQEDNRRAEEAHDFLKKMTDGGLG